MAALARIGIVASCLVFLLGVLALLYRQRNRAHASRTKAILESCEIAERAVREGMRTGRQEMPELKYNYDTDGSSEYIQLQWKHVEPPLHWNEGHPDHVWSNWNGVERVYDPDGTLRRESLVAQSKKCGRTSYWYEDGQLAACGFYQQGKLTGRWWVWDQSPLPYFIDF